MITLLLFASLCFSQTKYTNPAVENISDVQKKLLKRISVDQSQFDERVRALLKKLEDTRAISPLGGFFGMGRSVKTFWKTTDTKYRYFIEVLGDKDTLDIDISKGMITISGKRNKQNRNGEIVRSFNFSKSESVPFDAIASSANFLKEKKHLIIEFNRKRNKDKELPKVKAPVPGKDI